jgi:bacteriorhodopsin
MSAETLASVLETGLTASQFDTIYNVTSFGLACMMASTVFFFLRLPSFSERYKPALCYTGLVTFIAFYHYIRIFNSFDAAFAPCAVEDGVMNYAKCDPELGYMSTGHSFNDAYRYMDWLLTVPLLLIEIVLVMKLSPEETKKQSLRLGVLSGLMILNGYPGESSGDASTRWTYWTLSMLPFCYIVYTLFVGLKESQDAQPECVRDQVKWACWATVISWCTYPVVYILPMLSGSENGKAGLTASSMVAIQVGYTVSDVISKCGVGFLVYNIGLKKSMMERGLLDEDCVKADV